MKIKHILFSLLLTTMGAASAQAAGEWREAADLVPLAKDMQIWRQANEASFTAVADIINSMPELDKKRRGPYAITLPYFLGLGNDGFYPLVEALLDPHPALASLSDREQAAAQIGMFEALMKLNDPRSFAVYRYYLDNNKNAAPHVAKAAVTAMARLRTAESEQYVMNYYNNHKDNKIELAWSLGQCRSVAATKLLLAEAAASQNGRHYKQIMRALGAVVSDWALATSSLKDNKEALAARDAALDGLLVLEKSLPAKSDDAKNDLKAIELVQKMASPEALESARQRAAANK